MVEALSKIARKKNITLGQLSLAWLLAQKSWIAPIPGTTKRHRLEENIGSTNAVLTADELAEICSTVDGIVLVGERYPEYFKKHFPIFFQKKRWITHLLKFLMDLEFKS